MKRLPGFLLVAALFLIAGCAVDQGAGEPAGNGRAGKTFRWKMVTTWPANFPVFQEGVVKFAREVEAMSNGRLQIQVFAGGELIPALQVFDAVSQGAVELGHGSAYYWAGKVPAAQFFSTVPFGMTAKGMEAWLYHGDGLKLWRELYLPFKVLPFPMGNTGVQMGGWFNKRIDTLEDIKGLRMRIPGLGGKVLKRASGNPVLMSGGEIYTALERGTIDATEWVAPFHDLRLGLNRAAEFYYYPGWHEPGTELELLVNSERWAELPVDLQAIITAAAASISNWMYSAMEYNNTRALQALQEKQNVKVLEFPAQVMRGLHEMTRQTLADEAAKDADFSKIYQAYESFRRAHSKWDALSDASYQRALSE